MRGNACMYIFFFLFFVDRRACVRVTRRARVSINFSTHSIHLAAEVNFSGKPRECAGKRIISFVIFSAPADTIFLTIFVGTKKLEGCILKNVHNFETNGLPDEALRSTHFSSGIVHNIFVFQFRRSFKNYFVQI